MTKETIDRVIKEIEQELPSFSISEKNLEKFGKVSALDDTYLSYVNGLGGYIKFLALLTKKLQFKNIVELGNREGLSTLAIYDQLPQDSKFMSIDIEKDIRYCPDAMLHDSRVSLPIGDACSLNIIQKVPMGIDLLFSDTIHYDFQIRDEFEIYQHLLADKALVAIDDINLNDKGDFWKDVNYAKWDLTELCHASGWGLFLFERKTTISEQERWQNAVAASSKIWERKATEYQKTISEKEKSSLVFISKKYIKKVPGLYKAFCFINNKFNIIKVDTRP